MRLWIANTKKQVHVFTYRLVERSQPFQRPIQPGQQVSIDNLTSEDVDFIIRQNEVYGMRKAADVSRQKGFVGYCYQPDQPISMERMLETFTNNDQSLTEDAADRLELTARAIQQNIGVQVAKELGSDQPVVPMVLEVETVEDTAGAKTVAAGVEVIDPTKTQPRHTLSRKR